MNSTPEGMKLIIPIHEFNQLEKYVTGKVDFRTAIISIIGRCTIPIEHELVSKNQYGTRIIINSDNLSSTILELYHSLFSLQDCK